MHKNHTFLAGLRQDTAGNILPMAAIGAVVAASIVGAGVDLSRSYRARSQLQSACDSAVLAGRRTVTTNGFDNASKDAAKSYFATNFVDSEQETRSTRFEPTSSDNGITVDGEASTTLDTLVMRLFGYDTFNLTVKCSSSMGVGNSDVVLVLDTTGSMGTKLTYSQTRLQALQEAMKNFYTTLANATVGSNARIRYGFVPYSTTVNVGHLLYGLSPSYLTDKYTYSSRQAVYKDVESWGTPATTYGGPEYKNAATYSNWTDYETGYSSNSSCNNNKPSPSNSYSDTGSASSSSSTAINGSGQQVVTTTTTQPQIQITSVQCVSYSTWGGTRYKIQIKYKTRDKVTYEYKTSDKITTKVFDRWEYKPVEYDTSAYKTFAAVSTPTGDVPWGGTEPSLVSSTWNGCIHERKTVAQGSFSYSSLLGISPSNALDINIDAEPEANKKDTQWAPMWPTVVYNRYTVGSNWWGTTYTATTGTGTYGETVSSPCPAKAQGLEVMSKGTYNAYADSLVATGNTYLDIGMIWGGRLLSPDGIFSGTVKAAPANGGEVSRHIVFMTDGIMEPNNSVNQAWGLEWWDRRVTSDGSSNDAARHTSRFLAVCEAIKDKGIRIWVIAFTSGLSDDLKTCASDDSSFTADSSTELNEAFQEIAKQVGELRITK